MGLIEEFEHLGESEGYHILEISQHLFGATEFMKVLEHRDHHFKIVWLLVLDSQLKGMEMLIVFRIEDEKRHATDGFFLESVLVSSMDICLVNQINDF